MKIIILTNELSDLYTSNIKNKLNYEGYESERVTEETLNLEYNRTGKPPSFYILKNGKAAYELTGKQNVNDIIKWIKESGIKW